MFKSFKYPIKIYNHEKESWLNLFSDEYKNPRVERYPEDLTIEEIKHGRKEE